MKATTQARHVLRLRLRGKGNSGFRIRAILPSMSVSCSCNVRCKQTLSCLGEMSTVIINMYFGPGGRVTTHIHPDSEEGMVIVEGSLEAILGDQVVTLGEGDTVLAPAGVKHGFENRSGATARLLSIFPKTQFERVPME